MKPSEERRKYYERIGQSDKYKNKVIVMGLKEKYKGFKFKSDSKVIEFSVMLPFRIVKQVGKSIRCDDEKYAELQSELRKRIRKVDTNPNIVVMECGFIDAHFTNTENLDEICAVIRDFIKEQLNIYGAYVKSGHLLNTDLQEDIVDDEK